MKKAIMLILTIVIFALTISGCQETIGQRLSTERSFSSIGASESINNLLDEESDVSKFLKGRSESMPIKGEDYSGRTIDVSSLRVEDNLYKFEILTGPLMDTKSLKVYLIKSEFPNPLSLKEYNANYERDTDNFKDYQVKKYGLESAKVYSFWLDLSPLDPGWYYIVTPAYSDSVISSVWWEYAIYNEIKASNGCNLVYSGGDINNNLNIVYIQDSYGEDISLFALDVERSYKALFSDPTVERYKDKINIYRIDNSKDVDLKTGTDCVNPVSGALHDLVNSEIEDVLLCVDEGKVHAVVDSCPDTHLIHVLKYDTKDQGMTQFGSYYIGLFSQLSTGLMEYLNGHVLKKERNSGIAIATNVNPNTMVHEFGHLAGLLPDYYKSDPSCREHPCRMCNEFFPFSSEPKCYDKQKVVKYLNQWCDAEIKISRKSPASPYPNPVDIGKSGKVSVAFNVKYKNTKNPCYALMEIYDSRGALVDYVTSEQPVSDGQHILQWDGKDLDQVSVASGVYFYQVSIGSSKSNKDSIKGTVLK